MKTNQERLSVLLKSYVENKISAAELEELHQLSQLPEADAELDEFLLVHWNSFKITESNSLPRNDIFNKIITDERFNDQLYQELVKPDFGYKKWLSYASAAVVLIIAGVSFYQLAARKSPEVQKPEIVKIMPGTKKAILTLGDGSEIVLADSSGNGIAVQGKLKIEHKNGSINYKLEDDDAVIAQNKVTTPKGGEYQVILQDGTHVWLNAASSISYPVIFNGDERKVVISGEAYLEVAKNPHKPFIVVANGTEVKVLGTHFNVSAYQNDDFVTTTLIEGAVKVSAQGAYALLKPDQQAVISKTSAAITVRNVDAAEAIAWKNGVFLYNNENIKGVMKVIARWYDIDVVYQGDMSDKTFGGKISKFENFEKLLKTLELTGVIHFKIKGRRVMVTP